MSVLDLFLEVKYPWILIVVLILLYKGFPLFKFPGHSAETKCVIELT